MINYKDLIPGNIYKGMIKECRGQTWVFQYTPPKKEMIDAEGNKMWHKGVAFDNSLGKLKKTKLWQFENGWEFSEATEEEKALLQLKYEYEIY